MIYIFEDKKDDILSRLFQYGYHEDTISNQFVYTNGNGYIVKTVLDILNHTDEHVGVYMDMIPGNGSIIDIYYELKHLAGKFKGRLWVFPIVCSEYYFLRSIYKTDLIDDNRDVDICINKGVYLDADISNVSSENKKFCKNFEKYCKLILMSLTRKCVSHSAAGNDKYGMYYREDCFCSKHEDWCSECERDTKAAKLLDEYPCIPSDNRVMERRNLTDEEVQIIHVKLVEEFNEMCGRYSQTDSSRKYKTIRPIQF